MKPNKKSTITLTCTQCNIEFEKTTAEYKRRLAKLPGNPNFFCSRSCNSKHRNRKAGGNSNPNPPPPQYGNKHNQKYPEGTYWYVNRCLYDRRTSKRLTEDTQLFVEHIEHLWELQNGKCNISGVSIKRKKYNGTCETNNPFLIASLDRIDNTVGYQIGNVHWVSQAMNLARNSTELHEFSKYWSSCVKELTCKS